jgi:hypothetical protein
MTLTDSMRVDLSAWPVPLRRAVVVLECDC